MTNFSAKENFFLLACKYFVSPKILGQDSLLTFVFETFFTNLFLLFLFYLIIFPFLNCSYSSYYIFFHHCYYYCFLLLLFFSIWIYFSTCLSALLISPAWFLYDYYVLFSFMIIFSRLYIMMNIIAPPCAAMDIWKAS